MTSKLQPTLPLPSSLPSTSTHFATPTSPAPAESLSLNARGKKPMGWNANAGATAANPDAEFIRTERPSAPLLPHLPPLSLPSPIIRPSDQGFHLPWETAPRWGGAHEGASERREAFARRWMFSIGEQEEEEDEDIEEGDVVEFRYQDEDEDAEWSGEDAYGMRTRMTLLPNWEHEDQDRMNMGKEGLYDSSGSESDSDSESEISESASEVAEREKWTKMLVGVEVIEGVDPLEGEGGAAAEGYGDAAGAGAEASIGVSDSGREIIRIPLQEERGGGSGWRARSRSSRSEVVAEIKVEDDEDLWMILGGLCLKEKL